MKFKKIYLDMDGVIADFDGHFESLVGMKPDDYESQHGTARFWDEISSEALFFYEIPAFKYIDEIMWHCQESAEDVVILSSPARYNTSLCVQQKRQWLDVYYGVYFPAIFEKEKWKFAGEGRLLIDDNADNIRKWEENGGVGHLFTSYENFVKWLNSYQG